LPPSKVYWCLFFFLPSNKAAIHMRAHTHVVLFITCLMWNCIQSNFAPVEELGEAIFVTCIQGRIPSDFPEGVYIRNGGKFY
jgi:hypothetical protein